MSEVNKLKIIEDNCSMVEAIRTQSIRHLNAHGQLPEIILLTMDQFQRLKNDPVIKTMCIYNNFSCRRPSAAFEINGMGVEIENG